MKKIIQNNLMLIVLGVMGFLLLKNPETVSRSVANSLQLFGKNLIPSLFPFLILSAIAIRSGALSRICAAISVPEPMLLGLIAGYPMGAKTIRQQLALGGISEKDAQTQLLYCNNCGVAFTLSVIGVGVFGSLKTGLLLFGISMLSAAAVGLFHRGKRTTKKQESVPGFHLSLAESISDAAETMLRICGFILFFGILGDLIRELPIPAGLSAFFSCALELGIGSGALRDFSGELTFPLAAMMISWGGICVHCQTISVLQGLSLKVKPYLISKAAQGAVSFLLAWGLQSLCGGSFSSVFAPNAPGLFPAVPILFPSGIVGSIILWERIFSIRKRKSGKT